VTRPAWLDGLSERDASLSLALAALVHAADESGAADLDRLVMAYRSSFLSAVETVLSTEAAIHEQVKDADIVVGGVLLPGGAQAPHLIKKSMLKTMMPGSVIVDVAIDQGGCFETSKPTTHTEPTYVVDGVIHYCVANMPGAVARTSTMALAGATLPYGLAIANKGFEQAVKDDAALALGVNVYRGKLTIPSVAEAHKMKYTPLDKVLA